MTLPREALPLVRSTKVLAWSGVLLAIVLAYVLGYFVYRDRQVRLDAAERQSRALAEGSSRLLKFEFRNLERAMGGIAGDAQQLFRSVPESAPALLSEAVAGVVSRHAELQSIVIVDGTGSPLTQGVGLAIPAEARRAANHAGPRRLYLGQLQRADGDWVLPLLMAMDEGRWIVTRLRVAEIQGIVANLDTGRDGVVTVMDQRGTVLARSRDAQRHVGKRYRDAWPPGAPLQSYVETRASPIDGISRVTTRLQLPDYGLRVSTGLSTAEVLRDWKLLLLGSLCVYALYWLAFLYLYRQIRRAARAQNRLLSEVGRTAEGLRLAQQVGKTGTWLFRQSDQRVEWSGQVSEIFGQPEARRSASREEFFALVHPDDREHLMAQFAHAWAEREPFVAEYRIVRPDRQVRWIANRGGAVMQHDDELVMTGVVVDITSERLAQKRMLETERQFRLLFERNPLPFWVFDSQTLRVLEVNDAALRHYGYRRGEFLAMSVLDLLPPEDGLELRRSLADPAPSPEGEVQRHLKKDGSLTEVRVHTAAIAYGERPARLVLAEDVSATLAYERELNFRASHDAATGLYNVPGLKTWLQRDGIRAHTLVYIQMRGLEPVIDSLGQAVATRLLDTLANRIEGLTDGWGATAFVPAEAFVVALREGVDIEAAVAALHEAVLAPLELGGSWRTLEAWLGLADFTGTGFEQAVSHAALAAHIARGEGAMCRAFQAQMAEAASHRLRMIGRIHLAVERREFQLHFQPIFHLSDQRPACLEALLRWPQPDGGYVPPSQFIALSEDAGLILSLGDWVMEEAARCHQRLAEAGWPDLPIAINVSPSQLRRPDFAERLIRLHQQAGLPRGALHIEVTESVLMDRPEATMQTLRTLQRHGICTSLDDFGTGFSSMAYLQQLPLDALKIDQAFVRKVTEDERSAAICHALIALGHNLGLTLVAEGVETSAQLEWLRQHDCDQVQGYLLARPMELERLLEQLGRAVPAL